MSKFFDDFKKFAFKGNVIDMAVGVVIGSAFSKIVTSVVNDLIMPIFGALPSAPSAPWYILTLPALAKVME